MKRILLALIFIILTVLGGTYFSFCSEKDIGSDITDTGTVLPSESTTSGAGHTAETDADTNNGDDSPIKEDIKVEGNMYTNMIYNEGGVKIVFGVVSDVNMFNPNEPIFFFAKITGKKLNGKEATVKMSAIYLRYDEALTFTLNQPDSGAHTYVGSFTAEKNGVYTLSIIIDDEVYAQFKVGVVPQNEQAGSQFYFGVQPYICRAYTWGNTHMVNGQTIPQSEKSILDTIQWMGINVIREDGIVWETMQPTESSEINFTWLDRLVAETDKRQILLNWLIQATPKWAIKEEYVNLTTPEMIWSVCPQEDKYDTFITAMAERYAMNSNIIWEVWNEPDWEFFTGKPEDYINLLERTGKIFKSVNPNAFIYPGGLTVVNDPNDFRYKDSRPYFAGIKKLLTEGVIDTYSIHIHGPFNDQYFYNTLNEMTRQAEEAGLSMKGVFNTEAGLAETNQDVQAENLMAKILYTRGHDFTMYVQYDFRTMPSEDTNAWAIFDSYLQPKKAAIAYTVLIGKLGKCEKTGTIYDDKSMYADIYSDGENSVVTLFSTGVNSKTLVIPKGVSYKAYDIYGNETKITGNSIKAELSAIYIEFEGNVTPEMFSVK